MPPSDILGAPNARYYLFGWFCYILFLNSYCSYESIAMSSAALGAEFLGSRVNGRLVRFKFFAILNWAGVSVGLMFESNGLLSTKPLWSPDLGLVLGL